MNQDNYLNNLTDWSRQTLQRTPFLQAGSSCVQQLTSSPHAVDLALLLASLEQTDTRLVNLRSPDWERATELFSDVLTLLCLYKYADNYKLSLPEQLYKTGSVLYNSAKEEAHVVVCKEQSALRVRRIREKELKVGGQWIRLDEGRLLTYQQAARYVPLANATEYSYTRTSLSHVNDYLNLFSSAVRDFRALTSFPSRMLVVAPQHVCLQHIDVLPIRYQFSDRHYKVPTVQPLIEVVNRYADARDRLRQDGTLNEVVMLGDVGYRDSLNDLLNDVGDGYVGRAIVLSCLPLSNDYGFRSWAWSSNERSWLRTRQRHDFQVVSLPADGLTPFRAGFEEPTALLLDAGLSETDARAALNQLISQYLRDAIVDVPNLLAYQREQLLDPDGVWAAWFIDAGQQASLPRFVQTVLDGLQAVGGYITKHPAKLDAIKTLAKPNVQTWVVAKSRQVNALNQYFKSTPAIRALSYRELKKHLKSSTARVEQFVFPTLHLNYQPGGDLLRDYRLYRKALERGVGHVLQYEGLEDGLFQLCQWLFERDEHRCISHPDRQHWVNYTVDADVPQHSVYRSQTGLLTELTVQAVEGIDTLLDQLACLTDDDPVQKKQATAVLHEINRSFAMYFGVWKDIGRSRRKTRVTETDDFAGTESNALPKVVDINGRVIISYSNNYDFEYKLNAMLAKVQQEGVVGVRAADVHKNDRIHHFAISFDTCREALLTIPEARAALTEVRWASKAWRDELRDSIKKLTITKGIPWQAACRTRHAKISEQVQADDPTDTFISLDRFDFWLTKADDYLFPRKISHLEAILAACLKSVLPDQQARKKQLHERILAARDQSASFREVVTRLNQELTAYLIDKTKGSMLSRLSEMHLLALVQTKTTLTVIHTQRI